MTAKLSRKAANTHDSLVGGCHPGDREMPPADNRNGLYGRRSRPPVTQTGPGDRALRQCREASMSITRLGATPLRWLKRTHAETVRATRCDRNCLFCNSFGVM